MTALSVSTLTRLRSFASLATLFIGVTSLHVSTARADEQLFGFVQGAETLPHGRSDAFQFFTLRSSKAGGTYDALDFQTEIEHGFTDQFQGSLSLQQHYFDIHGVNGDRDALDNTNSYRFGGVSAAGKYRILSPFKDPIGLALRLEGGYVGNDDVNGAVEHEIYVAPEIALQKNFHDDTVICDLDLGFEGQWGRQPAEPFPRDMALQTNAGVSYRFAPDWYIGLEGNLRAEYRMFDFSDFQEVVFYGGPSLHYSAEAWWVTLSWTPQVWGNGIGEPSDGRTYAEETGQKFRIKIGFNF